MFGPFGRDLRGFNFSLPDTFPFADRRDRGNTFEPFPHAAGRPGAVGRQRPGASAISSATTSVSATGCSSNRWRTARPAKAAGLKAGDVIVRVNGQVVRTADELRRRLAASDKDATISIVRDKKETTIKVTLSEAAPKRIVR
jgi:S1-C subfamily serine protease